MRRAKLSFDTGSLRRSCDLGRFLSFHITIHQLKRRKPGFHRYLHTPCALLRAPAWRAWFSQIRMTSRRQQAVSWGSPEEGPVGCLIRLPLTH